MSFPARVRAQAPQFSLSESLFSEDIDLIGNVLPQSPSWGLSGGVLQSSTRQSTVLTLFSFVDNGLRVKASSGLSGLRGFAFVLTDAKGKEVIFSVSTQKERALWVSLLEAVVYAHDNRLKEEARLHRHADPGDNLQKSRRPQSVKSSVLPIPRQQHIMRHHDLSRQIISTLVSDVSESASPAHGHRSTRAAEAWGRRERADVRQSREYGGPSARESGLRSQEVKSTLLEPPTIGEKPGKWSSKQQSSDQGNYTPSGMARNVASTEETILVI